MKKVIYTVFVLMLTTPLLQQASASDFEKYSLTKVPASYKPNNDYGSKNFGIGAGVGVVHFLDLGTTLGLHAAITYCGHEKRSVEFSYTRNLLPMKNTFVRDGALIKADPNRPNSSIGEFNVVQTVKLHSMAFAIRANLVGTNTDKFSLNLLIGMNATFGNASLKVEQKDLPLSYIAPSDIKKYDGKYTGWEDVFGPGLLFGIGVHNDFGSHLRLFSDIRAAIPATSANGQAISNPIAFHVMVNSGIRYFFRELDY